MKKILINYANNNFYNSQLSNSESALNFGGFTDTIKYRIQNLDNKFVEKNKEILNLKRGAGYWLWKPYIILKTLESVSEDDIIFYCDSGVTLLTSFEPLFKLCQEDEKGIILFNGAHINKTWTKRDCFYYMDCDNTNYTDCFQLTATFQLVRKTNFSINFYTEFLKFCEDRRILTDDLNFCGLPNYESFVEHRHDQSILTNLKVKYNVSAIEDISQYGKLEKMFLNKQFVNHHRIRA